MKLCNGSGGLDASRLPEQQDNGVTAENPQCSCARLGFIYLTQGIILRVSNIEALSRSAVGQALGPIQGGGLKAAVTQRRAVAANLV